MEKRTPGRKKVIDARCPCCKHQFKVDAGLYVDSARLSVARSQADKISDVITMKLPYVEIYEQVTRQGQRRKVFASNSFNEELAKIGIKFSNAYLSPVLGAEMQELGWSRGNASGRSVYYKNLKWDEGWFDDESRVGILSDSGICYDREANLIANKYYVARKAEEARDIALESGNNSAIENQLARQKAAEQRMADMASYKHLSVEQRRRLRKRDREKKEAERKKEIAERKRERNKERNAIRQKREDEKEKAQKLRDSLIGAVGPKLGRKLPRNW